MKNIDHAAKIPAEDIGETKTNPKLFLKAKRW
jgi:hypothetical protein